MTKTDTEVKSENRKQEFTFCNILIPINIEIQLDNYAKHHYRVNSFLQSVLENDLIGSVFKADKNNLKFIPVIISYIYNELPGNCWGNKDRYNKWIEIKRTMEYKNKEIKP